MGPQRLHHSLTTSFFSQDIYIYIYIYFYILIYIYFFLFGSFLLLLNNKHYNIRAYLISQALLDEFICGLRGKAYSRTSLNVRNRESGKIPSFLLSYSFTNSIKIDSNTIEPDSDTDSAESAFKIVFFKIEMMKCTMKLE